MSAAAILQRSAYAPDARVAFQGERGAYGDLAIQRIWGSQAQRVEQPDFASVVRAVAAGDADYAVLPVHNVITGPVTWARAVLAGTSLTVEGHVEIAVRHCVLGVPGARLEGIRRVLSHMVALGQCTRFIAERRLIAVPHYDTAGAARDVALGARASDAAIASEECAERYGLVVLERDVSDRSDNATRFVVLSRPRERGLLRA